MPTSPAGAVEYFSANAELFTTGYQRDIDMQERVGVWQKAIARHVQPGMQVLDLGCGDGVFSDCAARGARLIGVDGSAEMVERCRARFASSAGLQGSFEQATIPFARDEWRDKFDVIMSSSVLEYVADLDGAIAHIGEWTKAGGVALVSLPNWRSWHRKYERLIYKLRGPAPYFTHVKNFLSSDALSARFDAVGFERLGLEYYARNKPISRCAKSLGVPNRWTGNLYLGIFRKRPSATAPAAS